ncbi:alpha/beta-hydrolase [Teratosphaeria destructans]|uniref:Alpha/beta-hydrolase n=1 Tax=Teratosphaeria destructans TaxID=418781 RepID=A0A9W7SYX5_9PEZI|nr:alpha/beta-hydrolase [Teratosphaeria destructans]
MLSARSLLRSTPHHRPALTTTTITTTTITTTTITTTTSTTFTRAFSTTKLPNGISLAYDLHEPPQGKPPNNAPPIIFIHGLFGSKKNNRSMSKVFARDLNRRVYALDMRNHGDSSHHARHDYPALAEDTELFLQEHGLANTTLIGHSMGAKTIMTLALRNHSDFGKYVQGMRKIAEANVTKQSDADALLADYEPALPIRQFLLSNLARDQETGVQTWRIPIKYLANALDNMADFPFKDPEAAQWKGKALFVRGTKSHYVSDETLPIIGRFFPRFEVRDVEAGHWVISERPEEFRRAVVDFLLERE